jgi:hypothetical protein
VNSLILAPRDSVNSSKYTNALWKNDSDQSLISAVKIAERPLLIHIDTGPSRNGLTSNLSGAIERSNATIKLQWHPGQ